ncbi:hypothetical protein [Actinacidiphila bryophytorum]|uniref:Uncharacterized protein n=1 Tax=Actinacidiphila bryophytorum TaxID=1436133 RepID=A0A9W4E559_9ACTN|nr:hypothetical protein [Actinacidiphila bryophytorum]MBM9440923.1 hypothetical protein [Actinacidiphila bryophytorum]MBN6546440.1 hypothetical protein [Actinacidiphila bryophytorum]CAG7623783.1 hypothetical protein SBRY_170009 [Actinacidiphila bryophytorum]
MRTSPRFYRAGTWVPEPTERELAEGLARSRWDAHVLRTALREAAPEARSGRLVNMLAPAADIVDDDRRCLAVSAYI